MHSYPLKLAGVACIVMMLGCNRSPTPPPADAHPTYPQADLDFRVPPFEANIKVQLLGKGSEVLIDATLVLVLRDLHTSGTRTITPADFDGEIWTLKAGNVASSESGMLWIYENHVGLCAFRIRQGEMKLKDSLLRFSVMGPANEDERLRVRVLDPDGKPMPSLRVGVGRMFAQAGGVASEVPDELWASCREVTDEDGWATLRVADGLVVTDVQTENIRYGRQMLSIGETRPATVRLGKTGVVRLTIDGSPSDLEVRELLLSSTSRSGVSGHWSVKNPKPDVYEVMLPGGRLFLNSFSNNKRSLLVAKSGRPDILRADQTLDISVKPVEGCRVRGRLVSTDGDAEQPVVGAHLVIYASDSIQVSHRMVTNERGEFATRLSAGAFEISHVRVTATNLFLSEVYEGSVDDGQQELDIGTLALPVLYEVSGEVVDANDQPLAFAEVACAVEGKKVGGGKTDAKGRFTAISADAKIDEFSVWPSEVYGRFRAEVEQTQPLRLRVP